MINICILVAAAAKLDDVANYIPARLSGWLMVAYLCICKNGCEKCGRRSTAETEEIMPAPTLHRQRRAMAGALEVQLAGNAYYFGKLYEKPTIGDGIRPVEVEDIRRSNRLLYATAILGAVIFLLIGSAVRYCFFL
ncbi:cobalamin biosynthesis protein [Blautia wexlerae]|nr:cobalamin biosynthesis protein [Blautia wexlerae]